MLEPTNVKAEGKKPKLTHLATALGSQAAVGRPAAHPILANQEIGMVWNGHQSKFGA